MATEVNSRKKTGNGCKPPGKTAFYRMADGGMIANLKRMAGIGPAETMTQKFARQDAELAAKTAKASPAPPAAPVAPNGISGYVANDALKRREQAAGLADGGVVTRYQNGSRSGGKVVGPGDGTVDTVPAKYAAGEYVLPTDTAQAIGYDKLDAIKDATHTPVAEQRRSARVRMADGGALNLESDILKNPRFTGAGPQADFLASARQFTDPVQVAARNTAYSQPPVAAAPIASVERPIRSVASMSPEAQAFNASRTGPFQTGNGTTNTFQQLSQNVKAATGLGNVPSMGGVVDKVATAGRNAAGTLSRVAGRLAAPIGIGVEGFDVAKVANDPNATGIDVGTQAAQGVGRMATAGAGAAAGAALGTAAFPGVGTLVGGLAGGALGYYGANKAIEAGRTAAGVDPRAPADRIMSTPPPAQASAASLGRGTPQRRDFLGDPGSIAQQVKGMGTVDTTMPGQDPGQGPLLRGQSGTDMGNGISKFTQNGKTLYSNVSGPDNDKLMSNRPGVSVMPGMSREQIDATLGGRSADQTFGDNAIRAANLRDGVDINRGIGGNGPTMSVIGDSGGFGILDKGYQERRNAGFALSSITANKQQKAAAIQALGAVDRRQEQSAAIAADAAGRSMADATTRRGQNAQNAMANAQNTLATAKFGLDQRNSDRAGAGIDLDNKAKQRLADVQGVLLDDKSDEGQRARATEKIRALQNNYAKEVPDLFTTTPIPFKTDPMTGQISGGGAIVTDRRTGDTRIISAEEAKGQSSASSKAKEQPEGTRLTGKDGKAYIVKNGVPTLL